MPAGKTAKAGPGGGSRIGWTDERWVVPDDPIIPFIEGDGTGPDIWRASVRVFDAAVAAAFRGTRRVVSPCVSRLVTRARIVCGSPATMGDERPSDHTWMRRYGP